MSRWITAMLGVTVVAAFAVQGAAARDPLAVLRQTIAEFRQSTAQFHHRKRHLAKAVSTRAATPKPSASVRSDAGLPGPPVASPQIADRPKPESNQPPQPPPIEPGHEATPADAMAVPEPRLRPERPPLQVASLPPVAEDADVPVDAGTLSALVALGANAKPLDAIEEGPCTVLDPVAVASLGDGAVALSAKAVLNERMAETVARWVRDDLEPAALTTLGEKLTALRVIDSYDCRGVNGVVGANLSQHGFANAIDVAAFRIGNRWITVGGDKKDKIDDARFLDAAKYSGCRRFMTEIGPGLDLHHRNHFHLDLRPHGKNGTAKFCQ